MDLTEIGKATERVSYMERCFDALRLAFRAGEKPDEEALSALTGYYESGLWLRDYELDEKGLLPRDLKRGVLSQDAVYDFLAGLKKENGHSGEQPLDSE